MTPTPWKYVQSVDSPNTWYVMTANDEDPTLVATCRGPIAMEIARLIARESRKLPFEDTTVKFEKLEDANYAFCKFCK